MLHERLTPLELPAAQVCVTDATRAVTPPGKVNLGIRRVIQKGSSSLEQVRQIRA
jgi:hypothetical protein